MASGVVVDDDDDDDNVGRHNSTTRAAYRQLAEPVAHLQFRILDSGGASRGR